MWITCLTELQKKPEVPLGASVGESGGSPSDTASLNIKLNDQSLNKD